MAAGKRLALAVGTICAVLTGAVAGAAGQCDTARTTMERLICFDPSIAARDAAMTQLYKMNRTPTGESSLYQQRAWLSSALACRTAACLRQRYDDRNSALLQRDFGRHLARRFQFDTHGRSGVLLIVRRGDWITYDATETVVGSGGVAAGDVSAATLGGTVRLIGSVARESKMGGCEAMLQRNADGSWSMATRHCFDGDSADLNERFLPAR